MVGKNKSSGYNSDSGTTYHSAEYSDSEEEYVDVQDKSDLGLSLEKLNLGPRKKLLVLNLNGFLVNKIHRRDVNEIPKSRRPDAIYRNFLVFRRPFVEEFMKFCLDRFEVGIWSSAIEHNIDDAMNCSIGSLKKKLLFVWVYLNIRSRSMFGDWVQFLREGNQASLFQGTEESMGHNQEGGPYSASNTLLIDDKPYKAFLNPPNTAIFPESYKVEDKDDKALDPKGELCLYLEALANANDVQSYVKENPFGKSAITSSHSDWGYYSNVQESLRKRGY